jgi:DNA-binding transcriptional MerR regulator
MPPLNKPVEKRFFTITEVAAEVGENASVLRYWEKEFRQLTPRTNARGKRFYTRKDIELIERIHVLVRQQGFTIDGARKVLQGDVEPIPVQHVDNREAAIERLKALRARLMGALEPVQLED